MPWSKRLYTRSAPVQDAAICDLVVPIAGPAITSGLRPLKVWNHGAKFGFSNFVRKSLDDTNYPSETELRTFPRKRTFRGEETAVLFYPCVVLNNSGCAFKDNSPAYLEHAFGCQPHVALKRGLKSIVENLKLLSLTLALCRG